MNLLDEVQEIDLDGFQVVSADSFGSTQRYDQPAVTLWIDQISFSKSAVHALNNCDRVRMEVNPKTRRILLVPVSSKDKDGIRWMNPAKEPKGRKLECRAFAEKIFKMWEWDPKQVYRANGRIVVSDQKVMLLFNFSSPVCWPYGGRTKGKKE